ncbi:MAG: serine/threonine protein kinase [Gemmatimonadaceae bacterium]|nr:serine/threonine protein kinase [Gemmatimonadaceae bacterium]
MTLDAGELHGRLADALDAQFVLGELLGVGGSAVVFRAHDKVLNRDVAIKVIDPALAHTEALELTFLHEAQIVASLEHPNIVPVYSAQSRDGLLYLVMRLLDGESLTRRLSSGVLTPKEAVGIALDVAGALSAAHARDVVHRDIKPDNVLLDRTGRAFVTDFGIALVTSRSGAHTEGVTSGTPGYMSPEQLLGEAVDGRTDIYAAGVLLFEMLAGRPPFTATSLAATLAQHLTQTPPRLRDLRPDVPAPLASITEQCLQKSAAERPTAAQLVEQLTAASTPVALRTPAQVQRATRRRRLGIVGALSAAGIAVLTLLIIVLVRTLSLVFADGSEPALFAFYESIPREVVAEAQAAGVLQTNERVLLAFSQADADSRDVLFFTDSAIVRRVGAAVRRFPIQGTEFDLSRNMRLWGKSTGVAIATQSSGTVDTIMTDITGTEMLRLSSGLAAIEAARQRERGKQ